MKSFIKSKQTNSLGKLIKIVASILIIASTFSIPIFGQEESGPVIKKLVKEVHDNLQRMEGEIGVLLDEKDASLLRLEQLQDKLTIAESRALSSEAMAEVTQELALLNNIDRKSVKIVKDAIIDLRPTLKSIQTEYETIHRMGHASRDEFYKWRNDMGKMFQTSAKVLNRLKHANLPEGSKDIIYNVESTIVLMLSTLSQSPDLGTSNQDELANQITILDHAFNQLRNIEILLDQERVGIKMWTYNEIVDVLMYTLSNGEFSKITDMPKVFQAGLKDRSQVINKLQEKRQKSGDNTLASYSDKTHTKTIDDLLNGKLPWQNASK